MKIPWFFVLNRRIETLMLLSLLNLSRNLSKGAFRPAIQFSRKALKIDKEGNPTVFLPTLFNKATKRKLEKIARAKAHSKDVKTLSKFAILDQNKVNGPKHTNEGIMDAAKKRAIPDEEVT